MLQTASGADVAPLLEWRFKMTTTHDGNYTPTTTVFLRINNNMEFVIEPKARAAFHVLQPKDFETSGVPKRALTACSGWFAGGGEDYYATYDGKRVLVYHRSLDELQKIERYKLIRRLPVTVRIVR